MRTKEWLTVQLAVDDIDQVGLVPPPEYPELLAVGFDVPAPHTQQVGLQAADEAEQDGIILGWS